jgi:hypothetical protein
MRFCTAAMSRPISLPSGAVIDAFSCGDGLIVRAPLADRIGRIEGQTRATLQNRQSYFARAYLYYLALAGHLRLDYDWLLALGDLCVHDVARGRSASISW